MAFKTLLPASVIAAVLLFLFTVNTEIASAELLLPPTHTAFGEYATSTT